MTALGDALRALVPFAGGSELTFRAVGAARDVLRKCAPCEQCGGDGFRGKCAFCSGLGFTPASVEAAIAKAEGST